MEACRIDLYEGNGYVGTVKYRIAKCDYCNWRGSYYERRDEAANQLKTHRASARHKNSLRRKKTRHTWTFAADRRFPMAEEVYFVQNDLGQEGDFLVLRIGERERIVGLYKNEYNEDCSFRDLDGYTMVCIAKDTTFDEAVALLQTYFVERYPLTVEQFLHNYHV